MQSSNKTQFLYFNLCLCVVLDSLSCSFRSTCISFVTNSYVSVFVVEVYLEHMTCISGEHEKFMSEVTGFCGCEIIRRYVLT
jgi:hypothetical protein